jgi:FkbM family methyltransferase
VLGGALKQRLVRALTKDTRASSMLERLGALTLADRLDAIRFGDDVVVVPLPLGPGQLRAHRIKLLGFNGRDTAAAAIRRNGWGGFEAPTPEVIVRAVRAFPGLTYDVGANSGIYALLAVEASPDVRVIAFEPFPPALQALRANLALNRSSGRVDVVAAAVSASVGTAKLHVPADSGLLETSASLNGGFKDDIEDVVEVRTTTLDDDWRERGRPLVSLIKIDTETTEDQVLEGAHELVRSQRPLVVYELLPGGNATAIREFAHEHDLINVRMTGSSAEVDAPIAHDPTGWNQILAPRERRDHVVALLEATRLHVTDGRDGPHGGQGSAPRDGSPPWAGAGHAVIERVELVDADGRPTDTVRTGDAVAVRLHVEAFEPVPRPVFGLAIFADDGRLVTGPNTREAHVELEAIHGKGVVELVVERMLLLAGGYDVTVSLYDHDIEHAYDFQKHVLHFDVEHGTPRETFGGVVSLAGRWSARFEATPP